MDAVSRLSLPRRERLRHRQPSAKLQCSATGAPCQSNRRQRATAPAWRPRPAPSVGGNGSPQRQVSPVTWKRSAPCPAPAAAARPGPRGGDGGRRLRPGRPWLSLGVAGCQKMATRWRGRGRGRGARSLRLTCGGTAGGPGPSPSPSPGERRKRRRRGSANRPLCRWLRPPAGNGGLPRTGGPSLGRRRRPVVAVKQPCRVIRTKGLPPVRVRLFLWKSLTGMLAGDLARQCFLYGAP